MSGILVKRKSLSAQSASHLISIKKRRIKRRKLIMGKEMVCERQVLCDSRFIAEKFKKEHKHVLQKIDKLRKELDEKSFYVVTDTYTSRGQLYRRYRLSVAATLVLIMTFGKHLKAQCEFSNQLVSMVSESAMLLEAIQTMDIDIQEKDLFVYVAQEEKSKRFKIGISKNPERRVAELQTGNPEKLTIILTYKAQNNGFADETLFHKATAGHIRGEWFSA